MILKKLIFHRRALIIIRIAATQNFYKSPIKLFKLLSNLKRAIMIEF